MQKIQEWLAKTFISPADWLAAAAALLIGAAVVFYWFMPIGTSCSNTATGETFCQTVSLASSTGWGNALLTPWVLAMAASLGALYFHYRTVRILLISFPLATIAFFVLSFGMDGPFIPAALASLAAGIVLKPHRSPAQRP